LERIPNRFDHSIGVIEDFVVPESDYVESTALDVLCPLRVLPFSLVSSVGVPVEFHHQVGAEANEVPDVVSKRMLPSELMSAELAAS
jgi:hypothetical protein